MSVGDDIIRAAIRAEVGRRRQAGESQAAIARASGVHPVALSNYMRGARDIYAETAGRLLQYLEIELRVPNRR
ncbi:MAG: helix-turn-helix transcriptional regulator [Phycisphaerales bacterium]|nr:helix-turn-helix transcriptional regulator [Phycisphaerales bacterium]